MIAQPDTKHEMHSIKVLFPKQCQSFWMHLNKYDNIPNFSIMQKCPPPLFSILKDHPIKNIQLQINIYYKWWETATVTQTVTCKCLVPLLTQLLESIHILLLNIHTKNYSDNFIIHIMEHQKLHWPNDKGFNKGAFWRQDSGTFSKLMR